MKGAIIDCCTLNTCMFDANFKLFINLLEMEPYSRAIGARWLCSVWAGLINL